MKSKRSIIEVFKVLRVKKAKEHRDAVLKSNGPLAALSDPQSFGNDSTDCEGLCKEFEDFQESLTEEQQHLLSIEQINFEIEEGYLEFDSDNSNVQTEVHIEVTRLMSLGKLKEAFELTNKYPQWYEHVEISEIEDILK